MGYWLGITFSCLDVLCVAVFCDAFLERKTRGLRFVVGALLCGVLSYIATIFVSHISEESPITLLKFAALITVYFVFASLFYLGKFWMRLLVVLLAYAIFTLLEFCVLYSLLALLHIRYDEYVANMKFYLASAAITEEIQRLGKQNHNLERLRTTGCIDSAQYWERRAVIEQQLIEKKALLMRRFFNKNVEKVLRQTKGISTRLAAGPPLTDFDEAAFTALVSRVKISSTAIIFGLINGMKLTEGRTEP